MPNHGPSAFSFRCDGKTAPVTVLGSVCLCAHRGEAMTFRTLPLFGIFPQFLIP
jgi:hypothetical protein